MMRHLYEHTRTHSAAHSICHIARVGMDMVEDDTCKRDLYIRCYGAVGYGHFYATRTMAEAVAISRVYTGEDEEERIAMAAAGIMAYIYAHEMQGAGSYATVPFTNNDQLDPDLTGLEIGMAGEGTGGDDWQACYGYSSACAVDVAEEIEYILEQYMGAGKALAAFSSARCIQGPEDLTIIGGEQNIVASIAEEVDHEATVATFGKIVNFTIVVGSRGLIDHGSPNYIDVMRYGSQIWSILGDENIELNGLTKECRIASVGGPEHVEGSDEPYIAAKVYGLARFPLLTSDR